MPYKTLLFVGSLFISYNCMAEIYTWVDENGKKHFSDSVPEHLQSKSQTVDVQQSNTMPVKKNNQATQRYLQGIDINAPRSQKKSKKSSKKVSTKKQSCANQWREYRKQEMCYTNCRINKTILNTTCIKQFGCKNIAKPQC